MGFDNFFPNFCFETNPRNNWFSWFLMLKLVIVSALLLAYIAASTNVVVSVVRYCGEGRWHLDRRRPQISGILQGTQSRPNIKNI